MEVRGKVHVQVVKAKVKWSYIQTATVSDFQYFWFISVDSQTWGGKK